MGFLDNFKAVAVTATPIILIGGIYMALVFTGKAWKRKPVRTRSMSVGALLGGKLALERLVRYHQAFADAESLNDAEANLKAELEKAKPNFMKLQVAIAKLEMSGKETKAVEILKDERNQAMKENKSHEAYEIEMLLVEMLIYKGDYDEALKCDCLEHEQITDARRPLFMAIIHVMLGDSTRARECWENFNEIRTHSQWPPGLQDSNLHDSGLQEVIESFKNFEKIIVKVLKKKRNIS